MSQQTSVKREKSESPAGGNPWLYPDINGSGCPVGSGPSTQRFKQEGTNKEYSSGIKMEEGTDVGRLGRIKSLISEWKTSDGMNKAIEEGLELGSWLRWDWRDVAEWKFRLCSVNQLLALLQNAATTGGANTVRVEVARVGGSASFGI